ncbi:MAG TPA: LLM class F420-dependent oxidoreductase [Pseudonocardia sp.]|nr:LLM class F420-dependent oxidoreductase [Pseudonocardia sp.]
MPLGTVGVWAASWELTAARAAEIERLGYGTLWVGGSPEADLEIVETLLAATSTLSLATGIVNIWSAEAGAVADSYHRLETAYPGRFLLGIGAGHREHTTEYLQPYQALVNYLDVLDERGVPTNRRVLAALGPKVLRLSADRSAGAHPYLVPSAYTRSARETLGDGPVLAVEHKIALGTDREKTRLGARPSVANPYLGLSNYLANLRRLGYTDADLSGDGSDRLIDALVAQGDAAGVAAQLREHLNAGADHVAVHPVPDSEDPLATLAELAPALGLTTRG